MCEGNEDVQQRVASLELQVQTEQCVAVIYWDLQGVLPNSVLEKAGVQPEFDEATKTVRLKPADRSI